MGPGSDATDAPVMLADGQDVLAHATLCELRIDGSDRLEDATVLGDVPCPERVGRVELSGAFDQF